MADDEKPNETKGLKWTILVYLAGDNNLTPNCINVLQQLEAVQYTDKVNVLACFDSNTPWPKGSRYLAVNGRRRPPQNDLDWEIHNDLIPPTSRNHGMKTPDFCLTEPDPANAIRDTRPPVAEGLKRFLEWATKKNVPSERYMLILYGHGPVVAGQTFLAKENPPSSLRLQELQEVLATSFFKGGPKLDILACQNCVMNGVETAYEVKDQVDFMIGSQGLVLAAGWPYEKIVAAIVDDPDASSKEICHKLLKVCARNLIDYSIMDRSSEQSVCDLSLLREEENITTAIRGLADVLQEGLQFTPDNKGNPVLSYPTICDMVRIARLEAQAYWGEMFVDLFDFCERLLKKCNEAVKTGDSLVKEWGLDKTSAAEKLLGSKPGQVITKIAASCIKVQEEITKIVLYSYYIGSELQYSRGISIYFPWTMPTEPYSFKKVPTTNDFVLQTAFDTYCEYGFVAQSGWDNFLRAFFKATLRKVRRAEREFQLLGASNDLAAGLVGETVHAPAEVLTIDLQKSSSDTGRVDTEVWSNVKNYPRRNYLSPADCPRKVDEAGSQKAGLGKFQDKTQPPVSYLGWNISGIVAEVIAAKYSQGNRNPPERS